MSAGPPFDVVLADPAWSYRQWSETKHGAASAVYGTMTTPDICAIPVKEWLAEDAALFMWGTWPKLPDVIQVMAAWGCEYVTGFPWVKVYEGGCAYRGIGFWSQAVTEYLLIGKKGEPRRSKGTPIMGLLVGEDRVLYSERTPHSRKPEAVHGWIERLFPEGRLLELFARRPRAGWTTWGGDLGFHLSEKGVRLAPEMKKPQQFSIFDAALTEPEGPL